MKQLLMMLLLACSLTLIGCGGGEDTNKDGGGDGTTNKPSATSASPGDAVEAFARAMEAGDAAKVKELMPALAALAGNDKLEASVKENAGKMKENGGLKSVTIDKEEIDGDDAKVTATLETGNGKKETDDFVLTKVNDQWVITLDNEGKKPEQPEIPNIPDVPELPDTPGIPDVPSIR